MLNVHIRTVTVFHVIMLKALVWHSERYRIPGFQYQNLHDFEYQNTISIFAFRFSIFGLWMFFVLLWSKIFFGIRNVTEYRVLNIKTRF